MNKWQTLEEGWKLHLTDQELYDDPMPFYHELRSKAPVYKTPDGFWVVTDYANTLSILRDDRDRGITCPGREPALRLRFRPTSMARECWRNILPAR